MSVRPTSSTCRSRRTPPPCTASASLAGWLAGRGRGDLAEPFTFVVALDGVLRLAPRRSEHVALAGGQDVLAAGEMAFAAAGAGWRVAAVTNQSTGYCPDPDCWPAVAAALDRAGIPHPGGFTDRVVFRRCPDCGERNLVPGRRPHLRPVRWHPARAVEFLTAPR